MAWPSASTPTTKFPGWDKASTLILRLIEQHNCKRVLEVGRGANPCLSLDAIAAHDLDYTTNDVSPVELAKADDRYKTLCLDLGGARPPAAPQEPFVLIFSRMVNEHVADAARYYRNMYQMLSPGGYTFHRFSTPFTLPFAVNRVLPERLSSLLLNAVTPREDPEHHGKFHAYHTWCVGMSVRMVQRLSDIGFTSSSATGTSVTSTTPRILRFTSWRGQKQGASASIQRTS